MRAVNRLSALSTRPYPTDWPSLTIRVIQRQPIDPADLLVPRLAA
jgi:hypothetical protein